MSELTHGRLLILEAPNSALGSLEGNLFCEFEDGSSDSLSDCKLCTVAKEYQGLPGSSNG
jgi:hypothetical protein